MKLWIVLVTVGILLVPALSYAQSSESAVTSTIGYFYSASGQMMDAEDNNGAMSSYLTRGERNDGTSETFAVSNIKDITADLDSNGNVLDKYTYTAYGTQTSYPSTANIQNQTLSINVNPYTYDGYYTDTESGNYYLNARYYDPTLGIFLTSDSYNLPNRDMYVNGNPVMTTDPTGHTTYDLSLFGHFKTHITNEERDAKWHWRSGHSSLNHRINNDHNVLSDEQKQKQEDDETESYLKKNKDMDLNVFLNLADSVKVENKQDKPTNSDAGIIKGYSAASTKDGTINPYVESSIAKKIKNKEVGIDSYLNEAAQKYILRPKMYEPEEYYLINNNYQNYNNYEKYQFIDNEGVPLAVNQMEGEFYHVLNWNLNISSKKITFTLLNTLKASEMRMKDQPIPEQYGNNIFFFTNQQQA